MSLPALKKIPVIPSGCKRISRFKGPYGFLVRNLHEVPEGRKDCGMIDSALSVRSENTNRK